MLRLARLRPLAQAVPSFGNGWRHFPRVYASTQANTSDILQDIAPKQGEQAAPRTEFQRFAAPEVDEQNQQTRPKPTNLESPFDALNFKEFSDERFGDDKYTTRSYGLMLNAFPALRNEVDTEKLHAKLKYEQIYSKDQAHETKTVFKFKKLVTKNYRTIIRSWPQVYLNSFKYGNEHFLDELYDDLEGKYAWNNQLAYPDGSINLFCGTGSKGSPIHVKGDPLALTYDDNLHPIYNANSVRLELTKAEADARFPFRHEKKPPAPEEPPVRPPSVPSSEFETEAEEDARLAEDRAYFEKRERDQREKRLLAAAEAQERYLPEDETETETERRARWRWETLEDQRRPWRTMAHRGVRRNWDDRVLYDPVTMVRLVSYSARGDMSERYYYRDEITPENTTLSPSRGDEERDPDYDENHEVLGYSKHENAWRLDDAPVPSVESSEAYSTADPRTRERTRRTVATELLPLREGKEEGKEGEINYHKKELRKDLLDVGVLPNSIREDMVKSFQDLVDEEALREEDKWTYYNDYVRWVGKAMARARAEEYRKNIINENPQVNLPGMYHVEPTYYFKYVKINPAEGWIRFYIGEHNRAEKGLDTMIATDLGTEARSRSNTMKYPFTWTYSQYKLSREDIDAIKKVKWPPSLVPPPTSIMQNGDGSPQDQLARYFEKTYLQFGHDVRFNPQNCFDPEYDKLEDPNLKYMRSVGSSMGDVQLVPDVGPLDLSGRTDLTPAQRETEEQRLRGVIRRAAADAMENESESLINAYASQAVTSEMEEDLRKNVDSATAGHSLLWLSDEDYTDPDLILAAAPLPNNVPNQLDNVRRQLVKRLRNRFQSRGDIVYVYAPESHKIVQEYHGYRFRTTKDDTRIRIVRMDKHQNAKVVYYDESGSVVRTEYHPLPSIDFSVSASRERLGRSAWAFVSDAHAEVAVANGLQSKRAAEIKKAEQDKADALTEALSLLDDQSGELEGVSEEDGEADAPTPR